MGRKLAATSPLPVEHADPGRTADDAQGLRYAQRNDDLQERMQSITQQILSRTRLLHIIDQVPPLLQLPADSRRLTKRLSGMRKDIDIELVRGHGNQITAFNVSYTSGDPQLAQRSPASSRICSSMRILKSRQQQSEDTTKFLENQLEAARNQLCRAGGQSSSVQSRSTSEKCPNSWRAIFRF